MNEPSTIHSLDEPAPVGKSGPNANSLRARIRRWIAANPYEMLTMEDAERVFEASQAQLQFAFSELKREGLIDRRPCWGSPKAFAIGS